jgi:DNA-binding response OmpR family regulator
MARILVVEDDDAVRVTLGAVLTDAGYLVTLARCGMIALDYLRTTEFDVVLTDLRLGDLDGQHILQSVKRTWPDSVTLMLTGFASVESAIGALRNGAYDYLCKPCAAPNLLATVARAVERRRLSIQVREQTRSLETAIETARELHSALSARLEGTTALLWEREHVLVTICAELRTSLIAIAGLVELLMAARGETDLELAEYLARIRTETQALAERVNAAVETTRSESVELPSGGAPVELAPISLDVAALSTV